MSWSPPRTNIHDAARPPPLSLPLLDPHAHAGAARRAAHVHRGHDLGDAQAAREQRQLAEAAVLRVRHGEACREPRAAALGREVRGGEGRAPVRGREDRVDGRVGVDGSGMGQIGGWVVEGGEWRMEEER